MIEAKMQHKKMKRMKELNEIEVFRNEIKFNSSVMSQLNVVNTVGANLISNLISLAFAKFIFDFQN